MTGPAAGVRRTPDGVLYRPGHVLAAEAGADEARGALGRLATGEQERYGVVRFDLAPGRDPVEVAAEVRRRTGRGVVTPVHVLAAQTGDDLRVGEPRPPWGDLPAPDPDGPVVAILDRIGTHPVLDPRVGEPAEPGGEVGTFAAGLVARRASRARLRGVAALDRDGLVDEWALLDAVAAVRAGAPAVVVLPFGGVTLADEMPPGLERAVALLSETAAVVAPAGTGPRTTWPAASSQVIAVADDLDLAGHPPWVDAGENVGSPVSTWPGAAYAPAGAWARWSGGAFAAAEAAGAIADLLGDRSDDPREAALAYLDRNFLSRLAGTGNSGPAAAIGVGGDTADARADPPLGSGRGPGRPITGPVAILGGGTDRQLVGTGFAADPGALPLPPAEPLAPDREHVYWIEIGATTPRGSIDRPQGRVLPLRTRPGTRITVALFSYAGELVLTEGADTGELLVDPAGRCVVSRSPDRRGAAGVPRMFFPVRTPPRPGSYRLRCNLYCEQTLLQSRLVTVVVGEPPAPGAPALESTVDFSVTSTLDPRELAELRPLTLSVFVNTDPAGTQGFRYLGADDLKGEVSVDPAAVQDALRRAREAMRTVAWDSPEEWREGTAFVYTRPQPRERLERDLVRLARTGYRLWAEMSTELTRALAGRLPGQENLADQLAALMRPHGSVEFASKASLRLAVPTGVLYDYPLLTQVELTACRDAMDAIARGAELTAEPCFDGRCAAYDDETVVCPGGFWGFRHAVGLPQSVGEAGGSLLPISCDDRPEFTVAAADDGQFPSLPGHLRTLAASWDAPRSVTEREFRAVLAALRDPGRRPHVVYFFCHGVVSDGVPGLLVGPGGAGYPAITPDVLNSRVSWSRTRPLVFLNGCHTAALEPRHALNFVDVLVRNARASGVIGTEITVFESLATAFAEAFFRRFIDLDQPVGEAVRGARLELLARGNPLGLAYVPYVAPGLTLVP